MDSLPERQMQNRNSYCDLPDDGLVHLSQNGDHGAFTELVNRHHTSALKVALSILRHRQDAEDEVQNAFWKAYEHIRQFQRDARFSTWLTRIVVNQCLMRLRQSRRARFSYIDEPHGSEETLLPQFRDGREDAEQALAQRETAKVLHEEIRRTPPLLRNVFMLREVEQRPMTEVADLLGISVAAAKSRLLRARSELRSRMQRHEPAMYRRDERRPAASNTLEAAKLIA